MSGGPVAAGGLQLWVEQDGAVPHANGARLARRLKRAKFVSLPAAGHLPFLEDPEGFAAVVRDRLG